MYCEKCGNQVETKSGYCDTCGKPLNSPIQKFSNIFSFVKKNKLPFIFVVFLFCLGIFFGQLIKRDDRQNRALEDKIYDVQRQAETAQTQNSASTKDLINQLNQEKNETAKAEKQAQLAQQTLELIKKQPAPAVQANTFPTINTRAIVLIVCFDNSGNIIQSGSGTIVASSGYLLTNKHVVTDDSGNSLVCGALMNDGSSSPTLDKSTLYSLTSSLPGTGFYTSYDAALLKIDGAIDIKTGNNVNIPVSFPYIKPQGGELKQGDNLFIFGYPGASNLVFNVTKGIVSSFSPDNTFINTDAVIDHGNSGGAAITSDGRFVGIPTQKYQQNGDYLGEILQVGSLAIPN